MHEAPKTPALALAGILPETKISAAAASGAAVLLLVYIAGLAGITLPEPVAEAAVLLAAVAAGWLAPHTRRPDLEE